VVYSEQRCRRFPLGSRRSERGGETKYKEGEWEENGVFTLAYLILTSTPLRLPRSAISYSGSPLYPSIPPAKSRG
jgi:hypothetical protein